MAVTFNRRRAADTDVGHLVRLFNGCQAAGVYAPTVGPWDDAHARRVLVTNPHTVLFLEDGVPVAFVALPNLSAAKSIDKALDLSMGCFAWDQSRDAAAQASLRVRCGANAIRLIQAAGFTSVRAAHRLDAGCVPTDAQAEHEAEHASDDVVHARYPLASILARYAAKGG
mgnify:CR=1 FL=1